MIKFEVRMKGDFGKRSKSALAAAGRRVEKGLMASAAVLLRESLVLVPRDTEYLAKTGKIYKEGMGLETVVAVGYGGSEFPPLLLFSQKENKLVIRHPGSYAKVVHEVPATHDYPQQHDYLRKPLTEKYKEMRDAFDSKVW